MASRRQLSCSFRPIRAVCFVLSFFSLLVETLLAQQEQLNGTTFGFSFDENSFDVSTITLFQAAYIGLGHSNDGGNSLILTPSIDEVAGRALYFQPVRLRNATTKALLSFSTNFSLAVSKNVELSGEGVAFIMAPDNIATGATEGYLGWLTPLTNGNASGHGFAVEFDTEQTNTFDDIDDNHVGINVNSLISDYFEPAGMYLEANSTAVSPIDMSDVVPFYAWIEYNGVLNVTISNSSTKPAKPLLSYSIDLSGVLNDFMYVGFTSATNIFDNTTGTAYNEVYTWSFETGQEVVNVSDPATSPHPAPNPNPAPNPHPATNPHHRKSKNMIPVVVCASVLLVLFPIAIALWYFQWYRKRKDLIGRKVFLMTELDALPDHYGAHNFKYKDLYDATGNFSEKAKLGEGGFGCVYKGVLPGSDVELAVKRIGKTSKQGAQEFMAEVKIIGRMRHRNLVPLLGWCHNKSRGELLLVYEYMPRGSLDDLIFHKDGSSTAVLPWEHRRKILIGIATALHFLHEEYEQRVVHRDVKASNVMLDADFNARLGDFGLARVYDHSQAPKTTMILAGTPGYMAPELFQDGKATEKTDVYSFGALVLEIATGRPAAERILDGKTLVDWVWGHFAGGNIVAAADVSLGNDHDEMDLSLILHTGLLCSHPDPDQRPTMRQSLSYLKMEAPFPVHMLPRHKPRPHYGQLPFELVCSSTVGITEFQ